MTGRVAVVGAGVLGRLFALALSREQFDVSLFDEGDWTSRSACSFAAAGLLAPVAEASAAGDPRIYRLGLRAASLWRNFLGLAEASNVVRTQGSLALARNADFSELLDLEARIRRFSPAAKIIEVGPAVLAELEPGFSGDGCAGFLLEDEGHIDTHRALALLEVFLSESPRVKLRFNERVASLEARTVVTRGVGEPFDLVIDTRGLGAREELPDLRGVRGELVEVRAPEVRLTRPVRVLHQRYPIYVVPRGDESYVIGATCLENESRAPISVQSTLELLGAAHALDPGFRQAEVTALITNCRPAFFDNLPKISASPGLLSVNGLYRHGFLLAPVLVEASLHLLGGRPVDEDVRSFIRGSLKCV